MSFHWKSEDSDMTEENVSENMSKAKQKELQAAEKKPKNQRISSSSLSKLARLAVTKTNSGCMIKP